MYYLSNRTIELLAELGDKECQYIKKHDINYEFGFVAKGGIIKFGPTYWTEHFNNKVKQKLQRLNKPTFRDTVIAFPVCRP